MIGIGSVMGYLFLFSGVGSLIGPPLAGFLTDIASTRFVPLGVVFFMSLLGALILARGSRDPVNFEAGEPTIDLVTPPERQPIVFTLEPV